MSENIMNRISEIHEQMEELPFGEFALELANEAARLADLDGGNEIRFTTRLDQAYFATFAGAAEITWTALSYCMTEFREQPHEYGEYRDSLFWRCKSLFSSAHEFAHLSVENLDNVRNQVADFFREFGYSVRPLLQSKCLFAARNGDVKAAQESFQEWMDAPYDDMSDCEACEASCEVEFQMYADEFEKGKQKAMEIFDKQLTCEQVPARTVVDLLRPLALDKEYDAAENYLKPHLNKLRSSPSYLNSLASVIAFYCHRNRQVEAIQLLEQHFDWALKSFEKHASLMFFLAARNSLRRFGHQSTIQLRLPTEFELYQPDGNYELSDLDEWLTKEIDEHTEKFNRRYDTDFFSNGFRDMLEY